MSYTANVLLSYSIFITAVIFLVRRRWLPAEFQPLGLLILVGSINELISTVVTFSGGYTSANNNVYQLLEALLLLTLFRKWGAISNDRTLFYIGFITICTGWLLEILLAGFKQYLVFFSIVYSFGVVFFSIRFMNAQHLSPALLPVKKSVLLICSCFIVYFSCRILLDSSWYLGLKYSTSFQWAVFFVMSFINCITNLCYALAILWIPPKQKYSVLSF